MPFARFDVVLLRFPFSEQSGSKQRPGLVISSDAFNRAHGHSVVAMITTAPNTRWPTDLRIGDVCAAGLDVPCVLRAKLVTVADEVVIGRVGTLADADAAAARDWVLGLLG